jgi:hypothetical protein
VHVRVIDPFKGRPRFELLAPLPVDVIVLGYVALKI